MTSSREIRAKNKSRSPRETAFFKRQEDKMLSFPYAGITRIRFQGCNLRLIKATPNDLAFVFSI
jgi:hypothetical protein